MARARKNTPAAPEAARQPEGGPAPVDGQAGEGSPSPAAPNEPVAAPDAAGLQAGEAPTSPADDTQVPPGPEAEAPADDVGGSGLDAGDDIEGEPCLLVRGPAKGRRRAGMSFGPEPTVVPLAALTVDQERAIRTDPELLVSEI